jgi:hypothetical protein
LNTDNEPEGVTQGRRRSVASLSPPIKE